MIRKDEAILSQAVISQKKIIYVEGNLDCKLIKSYLFSQNVKNVKVVEINVAVDDTNLPVSQREISRKKIITLIEKSNEDKTIKEKCLGIIDLDYDYYINKKVIEVENLICTDFNSIESFFLDVDIINDFLEDYNCKIEPSLFKKWLNNSMLYSAYFLFQLKEIQNIDNSDKVNFSELSLCNKCFCDEKLARIKLWEILRIKTKNEKKLKENFLTFLKQLDRKYIYKMQKCFLHGKYTLNYIICLLKKMFKEIKNLNTATILIMLKDKYILKGFYLQSQMFNEILEFAS